MEVKQEELARTNNGIAKIVLEKTRSFKVYDREGVLRIIVDDSPLVDRNFLIPELPANALDIALMLS